MRIGTPLHDHVRFRPLTARITLLRSSGCSVISEFRFSDWDRFSTPSTIFVVASHKVIDRHTTPLRLEFSQFVKVQRHELLDLEKCRSCQLHLCYQPVPSAAATLLRIVTRIGL